MKIVSSEAPGWKDRVSIKPSPPIEANIRRISHTTCEQVQLKRLKATCWRVKESWLWTDQGSAEVAQIINRPELSSDKKDPILLIAE